MLEGNLSSRDTPVKPASNLHTVEEVKAWVKAMGKNGMYQPTSAQLRIQALSQLTSILDATEPQDAATVLSKIEEIGQRWARLNAGKGETMRAYISRAKYALHDFLQYQADPGSFKGRSGSAKPSRDKKQTAPEKARATKPTPSLENTDLVAQSASPPATPPHAPGPAPRGSSQGESRTFPLGHGRTFTYSMPDDALGIRDAMKLFCHLMTMCEDFNPSDPKHGEFFSAALKASVEQPMASRADTPKAG